MTEKKLLEAAKKIQTWIHAHPRKATIVRSAIKEFDGAIDASEGKKLNIPDVSVSLLAYKMLDQHKIRVDLDDGCELPGWAVRMIERWRNEH